MKQISSFLVASGLSLFASATVITVSNNINSPGQYNNLQAAVNAASNGDTIYVHGSPTNYGGAVIKKRLTLIGTGHKPNKVNTLVSQLGTITLDTVSAVSGASGTKIIGFSLNGVTGYGGTGGTKNIRISRNYFVAGGTKAVVTSKGWTFENNIIGSGSVNVKNNASIIFRNNIFDNSYILSSNQPTVIISNNIFLGGSPLTAFSLVSNALIANNIFSGSSPKGTSTDNNTFSNNITYQTAYDTIPFGTNIGSGNIIAKDPKYKNVTANNFSYAFDFALDTISPGLNAGTDGKDVGIYGGAMPFVDMTGSPAIPQIKSLGILNPLIPAGDSLRIIIKANKQN